MGGCESCFKCYKGLKNSESPMDRSGETSPGYTNVLWNTVDPFTIGKGAIGAASFVAIETAVSQVVRRVMNAPYNVGEAMETHAFSVPFLGQLNFGAPYAAYGGDSIDVMAEASEGAKQIPAAIVGYTAMNLRRNGLKVPSFSNRDFIYMMVGKILSRPLTAYVYDSLPEDIEVGLSVIQALANKQQSIVNAVRDQKKEL